MSARRPLLTIAIPTYNRAKFLNELLACLWDQCVAVPEIELLVSDNASDDETPSLVESYQSRGWPIHYIRNRSNVGPDANFVQCFERAAGKYVWMIGDDDLVVPGAIRKVSSWLERDEFSLVYVNSFGFEAIPNPNSKGNGRQPSIVTDVNAYARFVNVYFTFISGLIVNKEQFAPSEVAGFSSLVGTNLVQLGWIYAALNRFSRGLLIHEPLIGMRNNNTGGYVLSEVFGVRLSAVSKQCLWDGKVSESILNGTLTRFLPAALLGLRRSSLRSRRLSAQIPAHRSGHHFQDNEDAEQILEPVFKANWRYWGFVVPVLRLPYRLAEVWFFMIRMVNRFDKSSGNLLLR